MSSLKVFISFSVYVTIDPATSSVKLSLLRLVWLNFCSPFSGPCSQGFFAFSLARAKELFYASPRTCSSTQSKEEPPSHFEKHVCLFLALGKGTMILKTF